jgi:hypothetical protein
LWQLSHLRGGKQVTKMLATAVVTVGALRTLPQDLKSVIQLKAISLELYKQLAQDLSQLLLQHFLLILINISIVILNKIIEMFKKLHIHLGMIKA